MPNKKENEIVLTEDHEYFVDGFKVPGVTQIIKWAGLSSYDNVPNHILDVAAKFGKYVHLACEYHDNGTLDTEKLDPNIRPYLNGWIKFKSDFGFEPIFVEKKVFSKKNYYCGTIDRVGLISKGKYENKIAVVDLKTSTQISKETEIQLDGYLLAYNETAQKKAKLKLAVHLLKDDYRIHDMTIPSRDGIFLSCLKIANWRMSK